MAISKFSGFPFYLSASREATTLQLITNTPYFAFTHNIHVRFYLLEKCSFPAKVKAAFSFILLSKITLEGRKPALETADMHIFFWSKNKSSNYKLSLCETEFVWMWYLNSEMGRSEYVYDLGSIQWCYRANICSQPAFHPVKERQKKKKNPTVFLILLWQVHLQILDFFNPHRYSSYWATVNLLQQSCIWSQKECVKCGKFQCAVS